MKKQSKNVTTSGWNQLLSLLPADWEMQAYEKKAMSYDRKYTPESLLRSILLYLSGKASLQETTVQAMLLDMVETSPEAFHYRFRKSADWLQWLSEETMKRQLVREKSDSSLKGHRLRIIDATSISQPGTKIGQPTWYLHFSLLYPSRRCSEYHVTTSASGESFKNFQIQEKDILLGDRIYAKPVGIAHVVDQGGDVLVRIIAKQFPLFEENGTRINLLDRLKTLRRRKIRTFRACVKFGDRLIQGRICAYKLSSDAARKAVKRTKLADRGSVNPTSKETLKAAEYVILFTTLSAEVLSAKGAMNLYRYRWPVELNFKRAKSVFGLGKLPCKDENSVKAWIHGKLLLYFLVSEKSLETEAFPPSGQKGSGRNKSFDIPREQGVAHDLWRKRETRQSSNRS